MELKIGFLIHTLNFGDQPGVRFEFIFRGLAKATPSLDRIWGKDGSRI